MKLVDVFKRKMSNNGFVWPYLIAEAGVNHEGNLDTAKRLVVEAAEAGANGIKFQSYKASSLASKFSPSYWDLSEEPTDSQYKLFQKYDKFWKSEYEILKEICDKESIEFLSTPFDIESAKFLNDLQDVFKISSSDITNKPFIEHIIKYGKPVILSTGASSTYEIQEAVEWIEEKDIPIALLHCVLSYPTKDIDANLAMIRDLQVRFPENIIGYSDHTLPNDMKVLELATLVGATILEKHFTHDKTLKGNDHYHSMDKEDIQIFMQRLEKTFSLLGAKKKKPIEAELKAREHARRSLVAKCNIPKGTLIKDQHLTWKRPAHGISPKYIEKVIGTIARHDISDDQLIKWEDLIS